MFTVRILSWNYDAQWLIQDSSEGGAQAPGAPSPDTPLMRAVISVHRCVSITLYAQLAVSGERTNDTNHRNQPYNYSLTFLGALSPPPTAAPRASEKTQVH